MPACVFHHNRSEGLQVRFVERQHLHPRQEAPGIRAGILQRTLEMADAVVQLPQLVGHQPRDLSASREHVLAPAVE